MGPRVKFVNGSFSKNNLIFFEKRPNPGDGWGEADFLCLFFFSFYVFFSWFHFIPSFINKCSIFFPYPDSIEPIVVKTKFFLFQNILSTERYRLIWSRPEMVILKTVASAEIIHISMVLLIEVISDVNPLKWNEVSILALDFTVKCVWCWHHIQSPIFFLWCPEFNVRRQSYLMISLYSTLERHPCKRMATKLLN